MEQLDLLWELESQWKTLDSYTKELIELNNDSAVKEIEKKRVELEKRLQNSKSKEKSTKEELAQREKRLSVNNFNMGELEKSLYDGHTSDIKQLEYLSGEKEEIKEVVNNIEIKVLESMIQLEELLKKRKTIEKELDEIEKQNRQVKINHESLLYDLNTKKKKVEKTIKTLEEEIRVDLLTEYNRIKKSRGTGIVELRNSVCIACNIHIPTLAGEKIRNTKEIFHCESCGRILYYKE